MTPDREESTPTMMGSMVRLQAGIALAQQLRTHPDSQTGGRERAHWQCSKFFETLNPVPIDTPPPARHSSQSFPNNSPNVSSSIQSYEPTGAVHIWTTPHRLRFSHLCFPATGPGLFTTAGIKEKQKQTNKKYGPGKMAQYIQSLPCKLENINSNP